MRTGSVEANVVKLNQEFKIRQVDELVALKVRGSEDVALPEADVSFYEHEYLALRRRLAEAVEASPLPAESGGGEALNDLLIRLRLASLKGGPGSAGAVT